MLTSAKLGLTALAAALLLGGAVSAASARNLSISNQNIRVTWSRLEFRSSAGFIIRCPATLEGSFHRRTIAKVARSLIGAITEAAVTQESCTGGIGRPKALPWHLTYESFTGTLPNITSVLVLITRFRFLSRVAGIECEYGAASDRMTGSLNLAGGEVTSVTMIESRSVLHLVEPSHPFCPASANVAGSEGVPRLLNTTNRIRITLI